MKIGYIPGLDGLRAISILMVIICHLGIVVYLPESNFWRERVYSLFNGSTGVKVFFVVSGFLITKLLLFEIKNHGQISLYRFYVRRALRLLPALGVWLLVYAALMAFDQLDTNWVGLTLASTYLINFAPLIFISNSLSHLWSLAVEEQFYLIWPTLFIFFSIKRVTALAALTVAVCAILIQWPPDLVLDIQSDSMKSIFSLTGIDPTPYSHKFSEGRFFNLSKAFYMERWTIPAIGFILIGCLFAFFNERTEARLKVNGLFICGALAFLGPLYVPSAALPLSSLLQAFGIGLIVLGLVHGRNHPITRSLELPPLRFIGRISYGLYLWHGLFVTTGPGSDIWFQQFPQNVALSFFAAILSFYFLEQPILAFKQRIDNPTPQ